MEMFIPQSNYKNHTIYELEKWQKKAAYERAARYLVENPDKMNTPLYRLFLSTLGLTIKDLS